jgi:hypothetical protein
MHDTNFSEIISKIFRSEDKQLELSFVSKTRFGYTAYSPNVSPSLKDEIWQLVENAIKKSQGLLVVEYNPASCKDDTIENCKTESVTNYDEVIDSINIAEHDYLDVDSEKISFYCISVRIQSEPAPIYFFRRTTNFRKLNSSGLLAWFQGSKLNKLSSKVLICSLLGGQ